MTPLPRTHELVEDEMPDLSKTLRRLAWEAPLYARVWAPYISRWRPPAFVRWFRPGIVGKVLGTTRVVHTMNGEPLEIRPWTTCLADALYFREAAMVDDNELIRALETRR